MTAPAETSNFTIDKYKASTFDRVLSLLRDEVTGSAGTAAIALGAFSQSLLLIQVDNELSTGTRSGWVESHEAAKAAKDWKNTREKLAKITQTCMV